MIELECQGGDMLRVTETFVSIQGEGLAAGLPCFFIRLSGCNLRCTYCDTRYAYLPGNIATVEELINAWKASGVEYVQVTGGEPLTQPEVYRLMAGLLEKGAKVLLETNGSMSLKRVPFQVIKIVDRKTPGSGMADSWFPNNMRYISHTDQMKFVITNDKDFHWAVRELEKKGLCYFTQVLFSPAAPLMAPERLAELILETRLPVRLQLQLHKILWGDRQGI